MFRRGSLYELSPFRVRVDVLQSRAVAVPSYSGLVVEERVTVTARASRKQHSWMEGNEGVVNATASDEELNRYQSLRLALVAGEGL